MRKITRSLVESFLFLLYPPTPLPVTILITEHSSSNAYCKDGFCFVLFIWILKECECSECPCGLSCGLSVTASLSYIRKKKILYNHVHPSGYKPYIDPGDVKCVYRSGFLSCYPAVSLVDHSPAGSGIPIRMRRREKRIYIG